MKLVTIHSVQCEIGRNQEGRKGWDVFISEHDRTMSPEWIVRGAYSKKKALEAASWCIVQLTLGYSLIHRGTKIHAYPGFGQMLTDPDFCEQMRDDLKEMLWKEPNPKRREELQRFLDELPEDAS
jgi:hypothetical protein